MCDYPFFIPQVVLFANSSLFWFKVTNEHREFRNYLLLYGLIPQILAVPFHVLFYLHFPDLLIRTGDGIRICRMECIILTVNNDFMDAGGYAHEQLQ